MLNDYSKCPHCSGDVMSYCLPPIHLDSCTEKESSTCGCPYDSIMECEKCSKLLDVGDYDDIESKIELFIEQSARPWK